MIDLKFQIEEKFILLKVEEKESVNLYTLINNETGDKIVAIGVKEAGLKSRDLVNVTLSVRTQNEKFDTKKDGVKYVETLNMFVSRINKVVA